MLVDGFGSDLWMDQVPAFMFMVANETRRTSAREIYLLQNSVWRWFLIVMASWFGESGGRINTSAFGSRNTGCDFKISLQLDYKIITP